MSIVSIVRFWPKADLNFIGEVEGIALLRNSLIHGKQGRRIVTAAYDDSASSQLLTGISVVQQGQGASWSRSLAVISTPNSLSW